MKQKVVQMRDFFEEKNTKDVFIVGSWEESIVCLDTSQVNCCTACIKKRLTSSAYREIEEYKKVKKKEIKKALAYLGEEENCQGMLEVEKGNGLGRVIHPILRIPGCERCDV